MGIRESFDTPPEGTRTPSEWEEFTGIVVRDPDGWDRSNFKEDWARPLTWNEWNEKKNKSTCDYSALIVGLRK